MYRFNYILLNHFISLILRINKIAVLLLVFVDIQNRLNLLRLADVRSKSELSPKATNIYKAAQAVLKTARRLAHHNDNTIRLLKETRSAIKCDKFFSKRVNRPTVNFILSLLRLQYKKSKGRRFSINGKIMYLSWLKHGTRFYRLPQDMFALPSCKTLTHILYHIYLSQT